VPMSKQSPRPLFSDLPLSHLFTIDIYVLGLDLDHSLLTAFSTLVFPTSSSSPHTHKLTSLNDKNDQSTPS
jgi:hypothetical protein